MVDGQKTNANGDALLISVQTPYRNVIEVTGYEVSVKGETKDTYYRKEFRWGTDGVLYGDWKELTDENLQSLLLDSGKEFWPQYKFTQVGDGGLEFSSIGLEITAVDGTVNTVPLCGVDDNSVCCGQQSLVFECCNDGFNPYAIGNAASVYSQLCQVVSNMFGFCVQYFKTSADQRSRDVVLHEYSLENVMAQGIVKILVPDNALPTREINFNPLMMDYPTMFEVHIVKTDFRSAFGEKSRPEVHDYLYFETYMNKMYEVNAVSETDDYMYTGAYWRVSLVQYQQRSAVKFDTEELDVATHTLLFDNGKFNVEAEKQEKDVRKPDQYNTVGKGGNDYVRRVLDKRLVIGSEPVYNNWTLVSKNHYALGSIPRGEMAVQYRYEGGWGGTDERMITCWIRPQYDAPLKNLMRVERLFDAGGFLAASIDTSPDSSLGYLHPGCYVRLTHTNYKDVQRVRSVDADSKVVVFSTAYKDGESGTGGIPSKMQPLANNRFLSCGDAFSLVQTPQFAVVEINGSFVAFDVTKECGVFKKGIWYGIVVAVKPSDNAVALWVYELGDGAMKNRGMDTKLECSYYKMQQCVNDLTVGDGFWTLWSCDMDLTNIRVWNSLCEEELHGLILSQYVVKDSHLCELVDNAQPELMLDKVSNPR